MCKNTLGLLLQFPWIFILRQQIRECQNPFPPASNVFIYLFRKKLTYFIHCHELNCSLARVWVCWARLWPMLASKQWQRSTVSKVGVNPITTGLLNWLPFAWIYFSCLGICHAECVVWVHIRQTDLGTVRRDIAIAPMLPQIFQQLLHYNSVTIACYCRRFWQGVARLAT